MKTSRKHLLALTLLTALSPLAPTAAFAQLHLEIAKAPDQAPKIAIV
ncbi:Tol-Pal system protein TolB, partial [Acinetobacter baumannii]